ncbi:MAG: hypothetical protein ACI9RM_002867 [Ulvibacter sp.]|jgi:hypothetical protein
MCNKGKRLVKKNDNKLLGLDSFSGKKLIIQLQELWVLKLSALAIKSRLILSRKDLRYHLITYFKTFTSP